MAGRIPAGGPAPNTLYNSTADGKRTGFGIAYRIYLPDRGRQPFGGVAPPRLTLVTAQGARIPLPDCPDLLEPVGQLDLTEAVAALGVGLPLPPLGLLGRREPVWKRYSTVVRAYADDFLDADLPDRLRTDSSRSSRTRPRASSPRGSARTSTTSTSTRR